MILIRRLKRIFREWLANYKNRLSRKLRKEKAKRDRQFKDCLNKLRNDNGKEPL